MAKQPKAPKIEQEEATVDFEFKDSEKVIIIGRGKFGLKDGKEFTVGGKLAKILIKKGAAKLK